MGRHSAPDEDEENEDSSASVGAVSAASESSGAADLRILRENPSLRARCAAAVVVPFALYTIVMIVIGRVGLYLLWVWIPTVLAGILVGSFLDRAHKALPRSVPEQQAKHEAPAEEEPPAQEEEPTQEEQAVQDEPPPVDEPSPQQDRQAQQDPLAKWRRRALDGARRMRRRTG